MFYQESLPLHGQGSWDWFRVTYNFHNERQKVIDALSEGVGSLPVLQWLQKQITTFLTERAAGKEALTVQPATHYLVQKENNQVSVLEYTLEEFGEQLGGYLEYDQHSLPAVREGLDKAFSTLTALEPGQGVVIYSPCDFYESASDVINVLLVKEKDNAKVKVDSWFLFLNQKLSPAKRRYWLDCHLNQVNFDGSPEDIVSKPQLWEVTDGDLNNPVRAYIEWMNMAFINRYNTPLFLKDQDEVMHQNIIEKVAVNLQELFQLIVSGQEYELYVKLWNLVESNQKLWANNQGIDPDTYWQQIQLGFIQLMGFHPTDGSSLAQYWDPIRNDWIGGTFDCGEGAIEKNPNHCDKHGDFKGEKCPDCKKETKPNPPVKEPKKPKLSKPEKKKIDKKSKKKK